MWFKLDLSGIELKLRIKRYEMSQKSKWEEQWCRVDFSFISEPWLKYHGKDAEVLLPCEVEELAQALEDLLEDKLSEVVTIECIEPDFNFILYPKRDLRDDPQYLYIREGCEIADIYMEMRIFFWNNGLTGNFLSIEFGRKEIQYLRDYLFLLMKKIKKTSSNIIEMFEDGILVNECQ